MRKLFALILLLCLFSGQALAVVGMKESDGDPDFYPWQIIVTPGTLTENADGTASFDASAGTGGDNLSVNSSAVVDPDFTSAGNVDFTNASNTITANLDATLKSNYDTAYTDRLKWDGGSAGLVAATGRTSLGLAIGTNVQAYDADLTTYAGITPSANVQSLLGAADYATMRGLLDLEAGTDFYSKTAADLAFQPLNTVLTELTALTDPGANRLPFWNDTSNNFEFVDYSGWDTNASNDFDGDPDSLTGDTVDDNKVDAAIIPTLNQNTTGTAAGLTAAYVDWNAGSGGASILNKPTIPTDQVGTVTNGNICKGDGTSVQCTLAKLMSGSLNWTDFDAAELQAAGVNWTSLNEVINSRAINWTDITNIRDSNINWSSIENLSPGKVLTALASGGVNWSNPSAVVGDGDKGDISVSSGTWAIDSGVVTGAKLADNTNNVSFGITIDGAGSAITTGAKNAGLEVPFGMTITSATMTCDQTGSIVVDIWKDTYANAPPTDADSITASAPPTISSAAKSQDSTLTGWTTAVSAGDIIKFNVDSAATVTKCDLVVKGNKT